jgi:AraC-like DNA-binding protein
LGRPLHELVDQFVPLEDLWNSSGISLRAQLIECPPECAVPLFETAISRFIRSRKAGPAPIVSQVVCAIDQGSGTSIDEYARLAGLGCRQLRHLFRLELGMGPKHYSRIARLRQLLVGSTRKTTWVDLALKSGFYDQAHMIREFRDLLNATPETFLSGGWRPDGPGRSGKLGGVKLAR